MMGEVILDDLVPKPQHNTAPRVGRGDHGKHRAAVKRRKPKQGGRYMKLERYTSIALGVPVGLVGCADCPNQTLYEGWSSWQSGLH
jgi:hypothetical protein